MEQIIILLLIFLLPGIIRKFTQAGKAKPSRPPSERDRLPGEDTVSDRTPAPTGAERKPEELPGWLRKLTDGIADIEKQRREEPQPAMIESVDVSPVQESLHEEMHVAEREVELDHSVMPAQHLPQLSHSHRVDPEDHLQQVTKTRRLVSDAGTTQVARVRWQGKKRSRILMRGGPGKTNWKRAIVMAEILGPPRASKPYRAVAEQEA